MPEISRFHGIVIAMYFLDHNPPHFHARFGGQAVTVDIGSLRVDGTMPPSALNMILDWAKLNQQALLTNWQKARMGCPLDPIAPWR
jgi:phosphomannomutase